MSVRKSCLVSELEKMAIIYYIYLLYHIVLYYILNNDKW